MHVGCLHKEAFELFEAQTRSTLAECLRTSKVHHLGNRALFPRAVGRIHESYAKTRRTCLLKGFVSND